MNSIKYLTENEIINNSGLTPIHSSDLEISENDCDDDDNVIVEVSVIS